MATVGRDQINAVNASSLKLKVNCVKVLVVMFVMVLVLLLCSSTSDDVCYDFNNAIVFKCKCYCIFLQGFPASSSGSTEF